MPGPHYCPATAARAPHANRFTASGWAFRCLNQIRPIRSQAGASPQFLEGRAAGDQRRHQEKENVGLYSNGGAEYAPKGHPGATNTYDFIGEAGKAVPYGVYDVGANNGLVNVGDDAYTGAFAVESIRRWWNMAGSVGYPNAKSLLITADGGGSNGSRLRLWKTQLADLAAETGLEITVCHLPPGTSKWNKIEHRMFSAISMNWRGRPLQTHEVVVRTIAATTNKSGLTIQALRDTNTYQRGIKISARDMRTLEATPLNRHAFHGDWNYTVSATTDETATRPSRQD